jgi:alpha-galactosidase
MSNNSKLIVPHSGQSSILEMETEMNLKISLIGAGSAQFSLSLIRDLAQTPNLDGCTVSFMDIDQDRLDTAIQLCRRYANEVGIRLNLEQTTDRRESLKDADFVINTALVLGNTRMYEGIQLAQNIGYRFGGSFHIMHDEPFWANYYQFEFFEKITEDILEICPQAWHLLVANPVLAGTTQLMRKYPQAKMIGLCHGYGGLFRVADVLGLDKESLTYELPGVNHFIWLTKAFYKGEDFFPMLERWFEEKSAEYWQTSSVSDYMGPKAFDLYQRFGAFPIGDTCNPGGGTWPWWYHTDEATEERWKESPDAWWEGHFKRVAGVPADNRRLADDQSVKLAELFPLEKSGEPMIPIIESLVCDIPRTFIINTLNTGDYVPGIPRDFEVEIPARVSKHGVQPIQTDGLPSELIAYILRDRVAPVEVELAAFERGSRELLLQLILMDPWTRSEQQARALLDAILALPWNHEMKMHYQ